MVSPLNYGGLFGSQKLFWRDLEGIFLFYGGGRDYMGDLLKYVGKGRGFNFKKLNGILIFSCYQFSRCFQVSLLLYETIVFLKFEHGQIIIYVHVSYTLSMIDFWLNLPSLCFLSLILWVSFHWIYSAKYLQIVQVPLFSQPPPLPPLYIGFLWPSPS